MQDDPLVELHQVSRRFPPRVTAVQDVNLRVSYREFLAIEGVSGSGKSTLLNILGLLDRPSTGTYRLEGTDTSTLTDQERNMRRRTTIGFVFQGFHLVDHLTTVENVALGLMYNRVPLPARRHRAEQSLEAVGMSHRLDAYPPTLSGGERQRVAIARAVAREPQLLLCDEPTGNLDSTNTAQLLDILQVMHDQGHALIVVTHDRTVAERARRTAQMRDGRLVNGELEP